MKMKRILTSLNFWIALVLLAANGAAWAYALAPAGPAVQVVPRLEPDMAVLRQKLNEGGHSGEPFTVEVTDQEAAETIAWYLEAHPNVPFRGPRVSIRPDGVTAEGVAEVLGLRIGISGRAAIRLRDGVPLVTLEDLRLAGLALPGLIRDRIQAEIDAQFSLAQNLPVIIDEVRLEKGQATIVGKIR